MTSSPPAFVSILLLSFHLSSQEEEKSDERKTGREQVGGGEGLDLRLGCVWTTTPADPPPSQTPTWPSEGDRESAAHTHTQKQAGVSDGKGQLRSGLKVGGGVTPPPPPFL